MFQANQDCIDQFKTTKPTTKIIAPQLVALFREAGVPLRGEGLAGGMSLKVID